MDVTNLSNCKQVDQARDLRLRMDEYMIYVPNSYGPNNGQPIIFALHGGSDTAA